MNDYVSPQVAAGAASVRTPRDVLEARKPLERAKCCPWCGADPPLAAQALGPSEFRQYIVGCENDDCAANPQVGGKTIAEAWSKWNTRETRNG